MRALSIGGESNMSAPLLQEDYLAHASGEVDPRSLDSYRQAIEPKIRMETLSSFGTRTVLGITYGVFLLALLGGLSYQHRGLQAQAMSAGLCVVDPDFDDVDDLLGPDGEFGCTFRNASVDEVGANWIGLLFELEELQGNIELVAVFPNSSSNSTDGIYDPQGTFVPEGTLLTYTVKVEACRSGHGKCNANDTWYLVLDTKYSSPLRRVKSADRWWDEITSSRDTTSEFQVKIFDIFQNQPAVGNVGALQGYRMKIDYSDDANLLGEDTEALYEFKYFKVSRGIGTEIVLLLLFVASLIAVGAWTYTQYCFQKNPRKWLVERQWLLILATGLLLYQNPVFVIIQFLEDVELGTTLVVEMLSNMGYSITLYVLLVLCDGLRPMQHALAWFYVPKLALAVAIFAFSMTLTIYALPELAGQEGRSFEAVEVWSEDLKRQYVSVIVAYFSFTVLWLLGVIVFTFRTFRENNRVPYLHNRYQQLSFRFFISLGYFVIAIFTVANLYIVADILSELDDKDAFTLEKISDDMNELLRNQGVNVPSVLFLTAYVFALLYLYLPPAEKVTGFNTMYFRTRKEAKLVQYGVHIPNLNLRRAPFCVETALMMLQLSWEAYNDRESQQHEGDPGTEVRKLEAPASNAPSANTTREADEVDRGGADDGNFRVEKDGEWVSTTSPLVAAVEATDEEQSQKREEHDVVDYLDVERHGWDLVDCCVEKSTDTHAIICVHKVEAIIAVAFRGSSSRVHWVTNLDFNQMLLSLTELGPPATGMESTTSSTAHSNTDEPNKFWSWTKQQPSSMQAMTEVVDREPFRNTPAEEQKESIDAVPRFCSRPIEDGNRQSSEKQEAKHGQEHDDSEIPASQAVSSDEPSGTAEGELPQISRFMKGVTSSIHKGARIITDGVDSVTSGVGRVGQKLGEGVGSLTESVTPNFAKGWVHRGFWNAYLAVRPQIHAGISRAVLERGFQRFELYSTGHSLGGALASLAAADLAVNLRVAWPEGSDAERTRRGNGSGGSVAPLRSLRSLFFRSDLQDYDEEDPEGRGQGGTSDPRGPGRFNLLGMFSARGNRIDDRVEISCYTFGQPRVGNTAWARAHDMVVPSTYRVTVDGDLVTNVPKAGYTCLRWKHVGIACVIDKEGRGSVIIDPSFMEKKFRTKSRRSVSSHLLKSYERGLHGVFYGAQDDESATVEEPLIEQAVLETGD